MSLEQQLSSLTEIYQDVYLKGEKIASGKRECESRYEMIAPHIKSNSVILDIGSSLGYFALRIASENPSVLVVSFESMENHCDIQKRLCEEHGIYNLIICQHRLSLEDISKWSMYVECIDMVLLLSVLHHFPKNDAIAFFDTLCDMVPKVIAEFPNQYESSICGTETLPELNHIQKFGEQIGLASSHMEPDKMREMRLYQNTARRDNLKAFIGIPHEGHKFTVKHDGEFSINDKPIISGLNVWNLFHFNVVWPKPRWWRIQALGAYDCVEKKTDVRPWNLLVTANGLKAIDYTTEFPFDSVASFHDLDMARLESTMLEMKPINHWK